MNFYETHFDEYLRSAEDVNIHAGMAKYYADVDLQEKRKHFIFYGPPGIGKYTQVLSFLKPRSPSGLKYERKIVIQNDKDANFAFRMSDVHFEIDMYLLGCNSKVLWHAIYSQIIDIIYSTSEKNRFIVCKNFQDCHMDLLDIFHSYVEHKIIYPHISLSFILITDGLSFLPNNLLQKTTVVQLRRPDKETYASLLLNDDAAAELLEVIDVANISNMKEIKSLRKLRTCRDLPADIFNITCDELIDQMKNYQKMDILALREKLYDVLIYQLDVSECIWYVMEAYLANPQWWGGAGGGGGDGGDELAARTTRISNIVQDLFFFFKYYNNNYRPIYHLENIFIKMINEFHRID